MHKKQLIALVALVAGVLIVLSRRQEAANAPTKEAIENFRRQEAKLREKIGFNR